MNASRPSGVTGHVAVVDENEQASSEDKHVQRHHCCADEPEVLHDLIHGERVPLGLGRSVFGSALASKNATTLDLP
jgi:hypothetical protein